MKAHLGNCEFSPCIGAEATDKCCAGQGKVNPDGRPKLQAGRSIEDLETQGLIYHLFMVLTAIVRPIESS